LSGLTHISRSQ